MADTPDHWSIVEDSDGEMALVVEDDVGYSVITWPKDDVWPQHWDALCKLVAGSAAPTGDDHE